MANFNLGTARGIITLDYRGGAAIQQAGRDITGLGRSSSGAHPMLTRLAVAAGTGVVGGIGLAIKSAADFEKGLSGIKAVSGASASEMDKVRDKALQLGADTAFSAQDAASAIEELVKAGIPIAGVMNGAADATVALAAAGGIDLPTAATIAANAMNQFGLSAEEMPNIADKIAGAANSSAIDVGDFGQSMQQAGAVAHLAGLSFDDTAVAITAMGNAGIKGSDAGTSLKTFLQNLQPTTEKQIGLMEKLGIITEKGGNQFFDASGKIKSMSEIAGVLGGALKGMSDQQKTATLETLFGSDAIRAAAVIAGQGSAGMDKLSASIGKTKAADVAKTRLDNLAGSVEQMKGSAETLAIQFGGMLTGAMRAVVNGITNVLNKISSMKDAFQGILDLVIGGKFTSAFGKAFNLEEDAPIVDQILSLRDAIINAFTNIINFIRGPLATIGKTIMQVFGPVVAGAVAGIVMAFSGLTNVLRPLGSFIVSLSGWMMQNATALRAVAVAVLAGVAAYYAWQTALKIARGVVIAYTAVQTALDAVMAANPIMLIVIAIAALVAAFIYLWNNVEGFRNFFIGVWNAIKGAVAAVANWFTTTLPAFFSSAWAAIQSALQAVGAFFTSIWNSIKSVVMTVGSAIGSFFSSLWNGILNVVRTVWNAIVTAVTAYINLVRTVITTVLNALMAVWSGIWNLFGPLVKAVWDLIVAIVTLAVKLVLAIVGLAWRGLLVVSQTVWNAIKTAITAVWNFIKPFVTAAVNAIRNVVTTVWNAIRTASTTVWNAIKTVITVVWNAIKSVVTTIVNAVRSVVSSVFNSIRSTASSVWNAIKSAISTAINAAKSVVTTAVNAIKSVVSTTFNTAKNLAITAFNAMKSGIGTAIDGAVTFITGIKDRILGFFGSAGTWLLDAGKRIVQGLIDGIVSLIGAVKDKLSFLTGLIPDWKGPPEKDEKLLRNNGRLIMQGLIDGIDDRARALQATLGSITDSIPASVNANVTQITGTVPASQLVAVPAPAATAAGGDTYSITVEIDPSNLAGLQEVERFVANIRQQARMRQGVRN